MSGRRSNVSGDVLLDSLSRPGATSRGASPTAWATRDDYAEEGVERELRAPLTGGDDAWSVHSEPLSHEHFLSPLAVKKALLGVLSAFGDTQHRAAQSFGDSAMHSFTTSEDNSLLSRLVVHTPRVVVYLQLIGVLRALPSDSCLWRCAVTLWYVALRLLVPYFFVTFLLEFGFNVAESAREAWFLESTMFYILVLAQLFVLIPFIFHIQRRLNNQRGKDTVVGEFHAERDDDDEFCNDDAQRDSDDYSPFGFFAAAQTLRRHTPSSSLSAHSTGSHAPPPRMGGSLSELGNEMLEVTALNEYLPSAAAFSLFFALWIAVVACIPSLFRDAYVFSAYLIELTSIACLSASLLFIAVDCRVAYHHVNELCAQASYEKLSTDVVSRARRRIQQRMAQHSISNNLAMLLACVNVAWFIVRVFFTRWTRAVDVVLFALLYFKELIYLLGAVFEAARVNDRASELSRILSQRMWRRGEVASNLQRLSMVAMLDNEPLGFWLFGRRWMRSDVLAVGAVVCVLTLLVVIRTILMQFSLTVLK